MKYNVKLIGRIICLLLIFVYAYRAYSEIHVWYNMGKTANFVENILHYVLSLTLHLFNPDSHRYSEIVFLGVATSKFIIYATFSILFLINTSENIASSTRNDIRIMMLVPQIIFAMSADPGLFYILAAEIALIFPIKKGLIWLLISLLASTACRAIEVFLPLWGPVTNPDFLKALESAYVVYDSSDRQWFYFTLKILTYNTFQLAIFFVGYLTTSLQHTHNKLQKMHSELIAAQHMLHENTKNTERLRISRDLHDSLGHHLTALNLHLQLAEKSLSTPPPSLLIAKQQAQELLSQIRSSVSTLRQKRAHELKTSLHAMCESIPSPKITLNIDPAFDIENNDLAHDIFCCIQESINNVIKHAYATKMQITLAKFDTLLKITIEDNGIGKVEHLKQGNGLAGIRERLSQYDGLLIIENISSQGIRLILNIYPMKILTIHNLTISQ